MIGPLSQCEGVMISAVHDAYSIPISSLFLFTDNLANSQDEAIEARPSPPELIGLPACAASATDNSHYLTSRE